MSLDHSAPSEPSTNASGQSPEIAVVIPAGGGGTRLWPRSRQSTPKQFLDLVTERSMLQETVDRVSALAAPDHVYVITNARHVAPVRSQLPEIPAHNIVGEPQGRDSAPAIGLMAALLEKTIGPDAVMVVLPADHVILKPDHFAEVLRAAADVARQDYLVTVGIEPAGPDTGFGYIQRGEPVSWGAIPAYCVRQFKEKPRQEIAEGYLAEGGYYWNAGMFIVRVGALRDLYRTHVPDMEEPFAALVAAIQAGDDETVAAVFPTLRKISFDYAVAEHADRVAVVPAEIGWSDVGSWARLAEVLAHRQSEDGNIVVGKHVGVDTHGSLIYSPKRLIATIGLEDIIVIDTPDAVLICPKSRSEDVKQVVDALRDRGDQHLL